jgi:hypothetical protein
MICRCKANSDDINAIVIETLRQGGDVFRCAPEHTPDDASVAAIFRY